MRWYKLILTVFLYALPGFLLAQGWIEYLDRTLLFGVNLPGEPVVEDITYTSAHGATFPARIYTAESGQSLYTVTVVDYTDAERIHAEREDRTEAINGEWIKDVRASVAYAAWNVRKRGGEVTYDAWSDIERVEGHQLQVTNDDQSRTYAGI
ncbi:MAG: hypothetical protein ACJ0SL_00945 [Candidatus Rariloculaceae bacterium]